jgi:hypothetical protein
VSRLGIKPATLPCLQCTPVVNRRDTVRATLRCAPRFISLRDCTIQPHCVSSASMFYRASCSGLGMMNDVTCKETTSVINWIERQSKLTGLGETAVSAFLRRLLGLALNPSVLRHSCGSQPVAHNDSKNNPPDQMHDGGHAKPLYYLRGCHLQQDRRCRQNRLAHDLDDG